ncbi:MAG: carbamoyltransferase HypF, partial [Gemmatimonadota bacterium]
GAAARNGPAGAHRVPVQHHHAHLAACLADTGEERALGVVWDGTGLGPDGTIWGGEFLRGDARAYHRVGHLRPFRLPGGDAAVREPRRLALALAHAAWGDEGVEATLRRLGPGVFEDAELNVFRQVLDRGVRAPWTTSVGRLFDGVASLLGLHQRVEFEGEAAMALEYAVDPAAEGAYPFPVVAATGEGAGPVVPADYPGEAGVRDSALRDCDGPALVVDWAPALAELLGDLDRGVARETVAARFHNGLAAAIGRVAAEVGEARVALTGGVFQNRVLTERAAAELRGLGLRPLLHRRVPANDGGLALGQVAVAAARERDDAG